MATAALATPAEATKAKRPSISCMAVLRMVVLSMAVLRGVAEVVFVDGKSKRRECGLCVAVICSTTYVDCSTTSSCLYLRRPRHGSKDRGP